LARSFIPGADHHHGRFFRKSFGGGVGHFEAADAIGDADYAQAAHASIRISREPRALFVTRVDQAELALGQQVVKAQHVIARNAKHVPNAQHMKPLDEVLAN
jgi:hypothetical protein